MEMGLGQIRSAGPGAEEEGEGSVDGESGSVFYFHTYAHLRYFQNIILSCLLLLCERLLRVVRSTPQVRGVEGHGSLPAVERIRIPYLLKKEGDGDEIARVLCSLRFACRPGQQNDGPRRTRACDNCRRDKVWMVLFDMFNVKRPILTVRSKSVNRRKTQMIPCARDVEEGTSNGTKLTKTWKPQVLMTD
jgi:hypothetical protein